MRKPYCYLSLYLIADTGVCDPKKLINIVDSVTDFGISCVQLRAKETSKLEIISLGQQILKLLKKKNIPLFINDHVHIAKAINADGVHLGQSDMSYKAAREILGKDKHIGLSIESYQQALSCKNFDVDYFGVGPVFSTQTKTDSKKPLGTDELIKIRKTLHQKPVVAIGGINQKNISHLLTTSVNGIAVASGVLSSTHPQTITKNLRKQLNEKIPCCSNHCRIRSFCRSRHSN